ncbi:MAG: sigma-70 family RNA polymerase sigma factor [Pirellulaceae bacterium]
MLAPSQGQNAVESDSSETIRLLELAKWGDQASFATLFATLGRRLAHMIALRLDRRVSGRIDIDDVLQEVQIEAWQHLADYQRNPSGSFYLWLRGVAGNKLRELHRHHLGTRMRDARRESPLFVAGDLQTSSCTLAQLLADSATSPSHAVMRAELQARLLRILHNMDPLDREVLTLRHFEQLTPAESAAVLQISVKAAGMRYLRALKRLKEILSALSELSDGISSPPH